MTAVPGVEPVGQATNGAEGRHSYEEKATLEIYSCPSSGGSRVQNEPPGSRRIQERKHHTLTPIRIEPFTTFEHLDLDLIPDINVFIGANGTGKTHL